MNNPYTLEGKTILVSGASSNIGRQIAIRCSEMGGSMVVLGRNGDRLQETYDSLAPTNSQQIVFDMLNLSEIPSLVEKLPELDGVVLKMAKWWILFQKSGQILLIRQETIQG